MQPSDRTSGRHKGGLGANIYSWVGDANLSLAETTIKTQRTGSLDERGSICAAVTRDRRSSEHEFLECGEGFFATT